MSDYILFIFIIRLALLPTLYQRYTAVSNIPPYDTHLHVVNSYVTISTAVLPNMQFFIYTINRPILITHSFSSLSDDRYKASSLPKPAHPIVRSRASSFKWEYPLLSLKSSSSFLRLLPHLPVTSIPSFIFPSITRCRRQFLRKMWPTHLAFHLLISCRILFITMFFYLY